MNHPLVRITDLSVQLGGNDILRGINADVERGKVTALIGLNGSGKTTLLRALLKEVPYRGRVEFFCGHDHRKQRPEYVGYVPQKLQIDARLPLTVRDLMALALQRWPLFLGVLPPTERALRELLARFFDDRHPEEVLGRLVENLSGGELQRVLMALAMHPRPELLLLDEPAAGIDFKKQNSFYDLIARVNRETGVTVVLVSHDLNVVSRFAHHVLCLKDGLIQCQGEPHAVVNDDMLHQVFGPSMGVYLHDHHHHRHETPGQ